MAKTIKNIREAIGTATPLGKAPRRNPPKKFSKTSLGGTDLKRRVGAQKSGNQMRTPNIYEAMIEKVKEKMKDEKKNPGKTDTGKIAEPVDTEPKQKMLTGYHE